VVVLDVDHYDGKRGADTIDRAEAWLGELPPTYKVTSRGCESPSGRYLYRKPAALDFTDSALAQFADAAGVTSVEVVRTAHRFSWAPGDVNHKNGLQVQCFDPAGDICLLPDVALLPELPQRWVKYLENPPVPQGASAYTRPADGPQWWLAQADASLGTRAELCQFAFDLLASRLSPEEALPEIRRVSVALDPSRPWEDSDFYGMVDANTERKTAQVIEREDEEYSALEALAGGPEAIARMTERHAADAANKGLITAALEQQVPFDAEMYEQLTGAAGITVPAAGDSTVPLGHLLRRLPEYDKLLWQELSRAQARRDAAVIQAGQFTGYASIAGLPAPPEPELLAVTGKDSRASRVIGRGTVTVIMGARSSGKTWVTATWAAQELRADGIVFWLDFERQERLLAAKMHVLGVPEHVLAAQFRYTAQLPPAERLVRDVREAANAGHRVLFVADAFRTLQSRVAPGTSAIDGDAVEQVYVEYLTPVVEAGATVVLLDHMAKTGGGTVFGSERKESAPDYVIKVEKVVPFGVSERGFSSLTMTKDRYGKTAEGTAVAYLWMPGDGTASAERGTAKYPVVPELRNWAPEDAAVLDNLDGPRPALAQREEAVLALVAANRLLIGPRELGRRLHEAYPDLFTSPKGGTDLAGRMLKSGKLEKDASSRYDVPAQNREVSSQSLRPEDLAHEEPQEEAQ
jgi:hypothetical protein